jgi:D-alanyl-D-alanine carboxypeptidase/D-alanyl-D-alanine-endopeptidase (penicillin-binding protein 4)
MKLVTTAAALETLGPDFVFRTTVEAEALPDAAGRVRDLFLVGRGDPNLSGRGLPYQPGAPLRNPAEAVFEELASQVAAQGVHEVAGNLVADDSYFLFEPYGHGWEFEDLQWGYGAPVTALAFNDNALFLRVRPGMTVGEPAQVVLDPTLNYYQVTNRLETSARGTRKRIFVERMPGSRRLDVWGQIPLDAGEQEDTVSVADPLELIGEFWRRALERRGITVRGRLTLRRLTRIEAASLPDPLPQPPPRVVLAEHRSLPLKETIKVINKVSQNLHAEMLLRVLAKELKGFGSLTVGLEVLDEFARRVGIGPDEASFADGSGLSRHTLVTPRAMVKLLTYMARSPHFAVFLDSLPVANLDGTLEGRFINSPARERVRAKTGTMKHTNALAGYMELPSGDRLAFSILGNHHLLEASEGALVVDRLVLALYQRFARRARKK